MKLPGFALEALFWSFQGSTHQLVWSASTILAQTSRCIFEFCLFHPTTSMSGTLPCKPEEGNVKQAAAILKGFPLALDAGAWPADHEEACRRQAHFLEVWFQRPALSKPMTRQAIKEAQPRASEAERKTIANAIFDIRSFLGRKRRNMKTGEKTDPVLQRLMRALSWEGKAEGTAKRRQQACRRQPGT